LSADNGFAWTARLMKKSGKHALRLELRNMLG